MEELLHLDACCPKGEPGYSSVLGQVESPLQLQEWDTRLSSYPDQRLRAYIVDGIRYSFCVGYNRDTTCQSSRGNMRSALENPHVIQDYLRTKCAAGRIIGPLDPSCHPHVHTSRFGVIPKSTPGKSRLIVDMSSPQGGSVNDGVQESWYSLSYAMVTDAAHRIAPYGRGAMLIKLDIRSEHRVVMVYPEDRWLMGMLWEGSLYIDTALPFGLHLAPKIFTALADAAEWIMRWQGVEFVIYYLDDFLVMTVAGECTYF